MQDKDNLEEFIRKEVNRIEFGDADAMWKGFQEQLEKEEPKQKLGFWFWGRFFALVFFIAVGSFLLGSIFSRSKVSDSKQKEVRLANETTDPLKPTSPKLTIEPDSNGRLNTDPDTLRQQAASKANSNLRPGNIIPNSSHSKLAETTKNQAYLESTKAALGNTKNELVPNQDIQDLPVLGIIDSTQRQQEIAQQYLGIATSEEMTDQEGLIAAIQPLEPIASIKHMGLSSSNTEPLLPLDVADHKLKAPKAKSFFFSLENSFADNNIRQHVVGLGRYFPLSNNVGIKAQIGGSLDVGYSFSQDSVFIFNGLSIVETRKDKDLKNLWNTYLDLGIYQRKEQWRFGLGFRGSYALYNQFSFVDRTQVTHLGRFDSSGGQTIESEGRGNWSGINRMSIEAYLNIHYHLDANYSLGIVAGKRLRALIKNDMAKQAYSNIPVKFGVVLNKHF